MRGNVVCHTCCRMWVLELESAGSLFVYGNHGKWHMIFLHFQQGHRVEFTPLEEMTLH